VEFDDTALNELAESIKAQGVMQPIVVRAIIASDRYEIIAGERRGAQAKSARVSGQSFLPFVRDISDETAIAMALN